VIETNEIIPINYDSDRPTVSAKGLHEFLGTKTDFRHWFDRMAEYGFAENVDFSRLVQKCPTLGGTQDTVDYQLTIDMAKELCMIQRTERGKEARRYFIKVENAWNDQEALMARALKMADAKISKLESKVENDAPKVLFADAVATAKSSILIGDLAKLIRQNGHEIGQKRLFRWLRDNSYLMGHGESYNLPTQYSMERGLMEIKERTINNPDGTVLTTKTTKITGKGQQYFINKFLKDEEVKRG